MSPVFSACNGLAQCLASSTASSTSGIVLNVLVALYTGMFDLLYTVLPYAIGLLVFYIGYRLARRALAGR